MRDRFNDRWRRTQDDLRTRDPRSLNKPTRTSTPASQLARALNLKIEETVAGSAISGFIFGSEVRIDVWPGRGGAHEAWVRLRGRTLPAGLAIAREGGLATVASVLGREDVRTGDPSFDAQVIVRGKAQEAVAVLDANARAHLLKLLAYGFALESGTATLSATLAKGGRVKHIAADIRLAAHLLKRMSLEHRTANERLFDLVRRDPSSGVRVRAFELLDADQVERAAERISALPPEIRWRLLLKRDPQSVDALEESLRDRTAPASIQRSALEALGRARPLACVVPLAEVVLDQLYEEAAEIITRVAVGSPEFAALGERGLLALVDRGHVEQRIAAIEALGARGTASAIEALLPHAGGFFVRARVKDAARRAIAAIERREELDRGRLSLAPASLGGELSVAQSDKGALALTDEG